MTQPVVILIALVASVIAAYLLGLDGSGDIADDSERAVASRTETAVYEPDQAEESPSPTGVAEPAVELTEEQEVVATKPESTAPSPTETTVHKPEQAEESPSPTSVAEPTEEQEPVATEPESAIDTLFITYVCNDRTDPTYPDALEQWGYLTHLGKAVICAEFTNGNHDLVANQQQLLSAKVNEGQFSAFEHMKQLHDTDPEAFYHQAASAGGSFRIETFSYFEVDVLVLAKTYDNDLPSIRKLHETTQDWARSESRAPYGYTNAGQVLAPTLTDQNNHLFRLLNGVHDNKFQSEIIYLVLRAMHHPSRWRWDSMEQQYGNAYQQFQISTSGDLWFHQWLLAYPDTFLAHYWPDEDWTPAPRP